MILSLGTNLGDRMENVKAMTEFAGELFSGSIKLSPVMETEPVGVSGRQGSYLNRIAAGLYTGSLTVLLNRCFKEELRLGRERAEDKGPRTADIDILAAGSITVDTPDLKLPHPEFLNRRFCIEGAAAIAPKMKFPGQCKTFTELLQEMPADIASQSVRYVP